MTDKDYAEYAQDIAAVCNILAPLFLINPKEESAQELICAVKNFDPCVDAQSWPFGESEIVCEAMKKMGCCGSSNASGVAGDCGAAEYGTAGSNDECGAANNSSEYFHDLSRAYQHLFIGPNFKAAPPWGSVYTDHDKVMFGQSCIELNVWMRKNGVQRLADDNEPQDHIGLMITLLAWLALNKPQLIEEFLAQHLLSWSHHYFEQFIPAAAQQHPFYEGLGMLADVTLEGMHEAFNIDVEYPRFYR